MQRAWRLLTNTIQNLLQENKIKWHQKFDAVENGKINSNLARTSKKSVKTRSERIICVKIWWRQVTILSTAGKHYTKTFTIQETTTRMNPRFQESIFKWISQQNKMRRKMGLRFTRCSEESEITWDIRNAYKLMLWWDKLNEWYEVINLLVN